MRQRYRYDPDLQQVAAYLAFVVVGMAWAILAADITQVGMFTAVLLALITMGQDEPSSSCTLPPHAQDKAEAPQGNGQRAEGCAER
jgi:hypothetical protein